jgi:gliding motility associated protien GldN
MNKCIKSLKVVFVFAICFLAKTNLMAQTPIGKESLLPSNVLPSQEDINGFTQDSSFYLKKNNAKNNRIPPKYPELRKEDVLFTETVWEDIDAREKKNRLFLYAALDDNGNQQFFNILLNILETDTANIKAYSTFDDRFTTTLSHDSLLTIFKGPLVKAYKYDENNKIIDSTFEHTPNEETPSNFDAIHTFRIKAQYIFDNTTSRMHYRIIGIAPIFSVTRPVKDLSGNLMGRDTTYNKPLFWVYYPKLRNHLANYMVYNPNNQTKQVAWSDLLEARYFDSRIVKTSSGNFKDQSLFDTIKDPKKRLEAAEKIKQRIDDYEQDRWVY